MPTAAASINRLRRILRNLSRILLRQANSPISESSLPSTKQSTTKTRLSSIARKFLSIFILILFVVAILSSFVFTFRYITPSSSPYFETPLPKTYASSSSTNETIIHIIVIIPPFTNTSTSHSSATTAGIFRYDAPTLSSLLSSLVRSQYAPHHPNLHLILTPHPSIQSYKNTNTVVKSSLSKWPHGNLLITNGTAGSLFERVVFAWTPHHSLRHETVALIDASRTIPPLSQNWYQYVMSAHARYGSRADVAAFSIQPVHQYKTLQIPSKYDNGADVVLYTGAPFVPVLIPVSAEVWREFQRWFIANRAEWFLWPNVRAPKNRTDPSWNSFNGNARADWTLWFSRFCALHDLYNVFPMQDSPRSVSLSSSSSKKTVEPFRFTIDGHVVKNDDSSSSSSGIAAVDAANLEKIVELGRKHGGTVSLTVISKSFLPTAHSWLCNVDTAGIRPPGVVWITTDDEAYNNLKQVPNSYALRLSKMRGASAQTGETMYGSPGYWLLMLERTQLIGSILERGVGVFAFETDQVWLRDPIPFVHRVVHAGDEVDIVGTLDTRHEIGGNFLYLKPTLSTRRIWKEVCKRFQNEFKRSGMLKRSLLTLKKRKKVLRYIENDQSILSKLVLYDKEFKTKNPVVLRTLDTSLFVDGRWYLNNGKFYTSKASRSPIMINNNFLVGIERKMNRLLKNGHWFYKDGKCDIEQVERAIVENEAKGVKASLFTTEESEGTAGIGIKKPRRLEGTDVEVGFEAAMQAINKELI